jgi:hypothetical protein
VVFGVLLAGSGCVGVATSNLYGTSIVVPAAPLSAELPNAGESIAVQVEDTRFGVAPYEVGAKRVGTYGYEASTIDLKDKTPLGTLIAGDITATLRRHGYRAALAGRQEGAGAPALVLTIRIHVFNLHIEAAANRMDAEALVSFEALGIGSGRRIAADAVGLHQVAFKQSLEPLDTTYQRLFESLYLRLRDEVGERISEDLKG